jgi:Protein of unknown function (DUF1592)/Protein of unknown function (DUF1588)/Protein of unknown function (DUF1587)/Protein of unknown function (DUF1585)/Protein of unknown function (DUF1595)
MRRASFLVAIVLALLGCVRSAILHATSPASSDPFLDRYCVTCHNQRLVTAGLALDAAGVNETGGKSEIWERVVRKLRSGSMPPVGAPRPDEAAVDQFVAALEAALDQAAVAHPNPGRVPVRRLNRAEYTNAIRDLLGVEIDGPALLPGDDAGYGFDNIADLLSVSPSLMLRYLSAAQKIAWLAFGADAGASSNRASSCRPARARDEEPCARLILANLARRAYRRPAQRGDVEELLVFYRKGRSDGGFTGGMRAGLERLLIDPEFLFRIEQEPAGVPPGTAYRVPALALASRLSFFLWSSIPDEELLGMAERGQLTDTSVLERQVRRMLADTRSSALVDNFAAQWLHLRRMETVAPNQGIFPEFDGSLRDAFVSETRLFLESQFRADRSVLELLTADYTFVNERLARHYQIPDVHGADFRRVTFDDGRRGGILGQGSLLTVTSYSHRTSPVVRGKWLLENVLGDPPPSPPDVPDLGEFDDNGNALSIREQMERHRQNPRCAICHARMDPLGFALENFDAVGRWRDVSKTGSPIDASFTLADGTNLDGPAGLRRALSDHRGEFVRTFTSKLLTYALGRGLEPSDAPVVRAIVRSADGGGDRWSSIILAITRSVPFQMKIRQAEHALTAQ